MTKLYKIRNKNTGLFSSGGHYPGWSTKGKTWSGIGPLKAHLNFHLKKIAKVDDWEIVIFEVYEGSAIPAVDVNSLKK